MKIKLLLIMLLGLGLSACKKEDKMKDSQEETFVLDGETFKVEEAKRKLSLILAVDEKEFVFVPDSIAFEWRRPTSHNRPLLYLVDFIGAIKLVD